MGNYYLNSVVQRCLLEAITERKTDTVRSIFFAIWHSWPDDAEVLFGEASHFSLNTKDHLLAKATQYLLSEGLEVHASGKHGVKVTDNTGTYWSANSPTCVM